MYTQIALGAGALLLEWWAVAQPAMGFFSCARALYLGLLLGFGPAPALVFGTLGMALRAVRGGPAPVRSFLADFVPLAVACALSPWLEGWARVFLVLDAYLLLLWLFPEQLARGLADEAAFRRFAARTRLLAFCLPLLGLAISRMQGWQLACLYPTLMALQWAAHRALISYRAEEREELRRELDRTRLEAEQVREGQQEMRDRLRVAVEESVLKEEVARELARAPGLTERLRVLVQLTRSLVFCRSAVVFDRSGDTLAVYSPEAEALQSSRLLRVEEPVVARAFATGKPAWLEDEPASAPRVFASETLAVALPLDADTVLYVGSQGKPWNAIQRRLLEVLTGLVGPGLEAARRVERLAREAAERTVLEQHVEQLGSLIVASRRLGASLSEQQVLDALEAVLPAMVPHQSRRIYLEGRSEADELARKVMANDRPLWLEDRGLERGERQLLAVPLSSEGQALGAILLGGAAFTRDHQNQLEVLGRQAALALRNARLHQEVVHAYERLQESEAQLIQSTKMAAVGQLAAGVAHELNTPLGTIMLAMDSLENKAPGGVLEVARQATQQARAIVEKLLYYSRDGRKGRQLTDLNGVLQDTLLLIGNQLKLDKVEVSVSTAPVPPVYINSSEIQQVVTNLLMNARDAVAASAVRSVAVRTWADNGSVRLQVRDSGPGLSPEVAERAFEPFFTTKDVGLGTGLGLSVSQQIVDSHGGDLKLENPGQPGACFLLSLPIHNSATNR